MSLPLSIPDSVCLASLLPLSLRSLSVCLPVCLSVPKSLAPCKLSDPPSGLRTPGRSEDSSPPRRSPRPSQLGRAGPASSHLVSPARAAAAAAIYALRTRGWSFKRRFPGARSELAASLMALAAANHAVLPPPPLPAPPVRPRSSRPGSDRRWICETRPAASVPVSSSRSRDLCLSRVPLDDERS